MILPFKLRRLRHRHLRGVEHIFNENSVAGGGVIDEHVRYRSHDLAALNDGRAAQECGQERTTKSHKTLKSIHRFSFFSSIVTALCLFAF